MPRDPESPFTFSAFVVIQRSTMKIRFSAVTALFASAALQLASACENGTPFLVGSEPCAVFVLQDEKLELSGNAPSPTGVLGDVCVAEDGEFKIKDSQMVYGTALLGSNVQTPSNVASFVQEPIQFNEDLSAEIAAAQGAFSTLDGKGCDTNFGQWKITSTEMEDAGSSEKVICIEKLLIDEGDLVLTGSTGGSFIFKVTEELKIEKGSILTAGSIDPKNVVIYYTGTKEVRIKNSDVEGSILAPNYKVTVEESKILGQVFSEKDIKLVESLVDCELSPVPTVPPAPTDPPTPAPVEPPAPTASPAPPAPPEGISINQDGGNNAILTTEANILGGLSQMTIEVTFRSAHPPGIDMQFFRYFKNEGPNAYDEIEFTFGDLPGGQFYLYFEIRGVPFDIPLATFDATALLDNNDHQLSLTWDNTDGDWEVYVDGVSIASGTNVAKGEVLDAGGKLVLGNDQDILGGGYDKYRFFDGVFLDVRIFDVVRTSTEISSDALQELAGPPFLSSLKAYWKMNDLIGGMTADEVAGNNLMVENISGSGWTNSVPVLV